MPGRGLRVTIWNGHVHERETRWWWSLSPTGSTGRAAALAMAEAAIAAPRSGGWVEVERP